MRNRIDGEQIVTARGSIREFTTPQAENDSRQPELLRAGALARPDSGFIQFFRNRSTRIPAIIVAPPINWSQSSTSPSNKKAQSKVNRGPTLLRIVVRDAPRMRMPYMNDRNEQKPEKTARMAVKPQTSGAVGYSRIPKIGAKASAEPTIEKVDIRSGEIPRIIRSLSVEYVAKHSAPARPTIKP